MKQAQQKKQMAMNFYDQVSIRVDYVDNHKLCAAELTIIETFLGGIADRLREARSMEIDPASTESPQSPAADSSLPKMIDQEADTAQHAGHAVNKTLPPATA